MRRYRKPQKFREPTRLEIFYKKIEKSLGWKLVRTVIFPALILHTIYGQTFGNEERRESINSAIIAVQHSAEHLPQFMLESLDVRGLPARLTAQVEKTLELTFPVSIFHIDQEVLEQKLSSIKEIASFQIIPKGGDNLIIEATQAMPVAIWRVNGGYHLITSSGKRIANLFDPGEEPHLALVVGDGADKAAHEIPHLHRLMAPISARVQGMIRVGDRRWDIMMDNGLLIMLPQDDAIGALEKVMKWEEDHSITSRSISRIDMRTPRSASFRIIPEEEAILYRATQQ